MFTKGGLLFGFIVSVLLGLVLRVSDGAYLTITDGWTIQLHLEFFWSCAFIAAFFFVVMFVLSILVGGLVSLPGFDNSHEEKEVSLSDFTIQELRVMDREDEVTHNQEWASLARANWDGHTKPVYEDYRGWLRDAFTDEPICNNHTDKRRVVGNKVVRFGGKNL